MDTMPKDFSNSQSVFVAVAALSTQLNMDQGHLIDN